MCDEGGQVEERRKEVVGAEEKSAERGCSQVNLEASKRIDPSQAKRLKRARRDTEATNDSRFVNTRC